MEGNILDELVLEHGKSEELRAALDCLKDASAADGGPRYSDKTCRAVARAVVCRNYARPILELSHMIVAASAGGRFEDIFWGVDRATGAAFHRCFAELSRAAPTLECGPKAITARYDDGQFEISYSRMPFLAAMLEFLVGAIGYTEIDAATESVRSGDRRIGEVSIAAQALSRRLYDFLKTHLPTVQARRRERHFLDFVANAYPGTAALDAIGDDVVLDYWCRAAATEMEIEIKTYRGVHQTACRLIVALDAAASRLAATRAKPIGQNFELGEVDPADAEWVAQAIDEGTQTLSDVARLIGPDVKFLTAVELETLAEIPATDTVRRRLPKSVLRSAVFGFQQARISNVLRLSSKPAKVAELCQCRDAEPYADHLATYGEVVTKLRDVLMTALALLHAAGHDAAIDLALAPAPDLDWGQLRAGMGGDEAVVAFGPALAKRAFFEAEGGRLAALPGLLKEARETLRRINRKGIGRAAQGAGEVGSIAASVPPALSTYVALSRFVNDACGPFDWEQQFRTEREQFAAVFRAIYILPGSEETLHARR